MNSALMIVALILSVALISVVVSLVVILFGSNRTRYKRTGL
jgi:phosphate starvation-inducible membrane PsiE